MESKHMERCSASYLILLSQQDTTTHLSEWPKSGTLTTPHADKDVEQQQLSVTADGSAKVQPLRSRGSLQSATGSHRKIQQRAPW